MIIVKLREAMEQYERQTGERMTYSKLADRAGLSRATVESIASRNAYNPSLESIGKICEVLECTPCELLELHKDDAGDENSPT